MPFSIKKPVKALESLMYEHTIPDSKELVDSASPNTKPAVILLPGIAVVEYNVKYETKNTAHDVAVNRSKVRSSLFALKGFTS